MQRGDLYLVTRPGAADTRRQRVFEVVSRQVLIDSKFSSVVCAPVYSRYDGLRTQVAVGVNDGLKLESSIHCDELASLPKSMLTHFVGRLRKDKLDALDLELVLLSTGAPIQAYRGSPVRSVTSRLGT